jgi:hypothetical protein
MVRAAALAAEEKTREELAAGGDDDDDDVEDESYQLEDVHTGGDATAVGAGATGSKKKGTSKTQLSNKRGAGVGIALSDDEEEDTHQDKEDGAEQGAAEKASSSLLAPAAAALAKVGADADKTGDDVASSKKRKLLVGNSMGSLLASMNRKPKNKKKKTGGKLDQSIADLFANEGKNSSSNSDKDTAAACRAAAQAALAVTGKMQVTEQVQFAGQSVSIVRTLEKSSKEAAAAIEAANRIQERSTLDKLVDEIKNPKKGLSAVAKSTYDWEKFKEDKGIGEELSKAAKEKSFVDKQAFLERVDQRTYDVELAERNKNKAIAAARAAKADNK